MSYKITVVPDNKMRLPQETSQGLPPLLRTTDPGVGVLLVIYLCSNIRSTKVQDVFTANSSCHRQFSGYQPGVNLKYATILQLAKCGRSGARQMQHGGLLGRGSTHWRPESFASASQCVG